ncbi:hypothetical protein NHX12_029625 [Muraenolepis orangiensis]|uniref:Uncharacterized protein n=1 Tax=Muraenolepis orangiensis TaxID=630683 RepID=A0A9Q0EA83_9TELE|nr:hypothetical protein NHX12_029625 [Muraenolepis orangiensis]
MGSTRKTNNRRGRGGEDHTGETTEPDLSPGLNLTSTSFEAELKVEMKCNLELQEEGRPATLTNKGADCLGLTPPQSVEIKQRDSEDITDKEPKEIIHPPPEGSHANEDHRKEEESEEHSEENIDGIEIAGLKTGPEIHDQEISEEITSQQHHGEDLCKAATDPQEKDYNRPPGTDDHMLAQKSFSKEITPHGEDTNSSSLLVLASDIRDSDDNVDTRGQHPPADLSSSDQISAPEDQWSLPNIKDDDKHISRRRKMGSSRGTAASGSKKLVMKPTQHRTKRWRNLP